MKPINYFVCLLLAGATQVAFSACSGSDDAADEKDGQEEQETTNYPVEEDAIAFPGAEGGGMNATGGRGGTVYVVTSLEDTKTPGTLRYAVEQKGARIVVFNVSGTIYLKSQLNIRNNDITIAGQTAPGDGVCVAHYPLSVGANNVIIRYLRFRMGDAAILGGNADGADAMGGRKQTNVIIDHCSISWSTDECASFYDNKDFTMQWCIISESLRLSGHSKGPHGYGGIWGGVNATFHHNLMAHHDSRTPRFGAGTMYQGTERTDMRNNVIYNWSGNGCYGGEGMGVNIVNNYYKPGPATDAKVANRVMAIDINSTTNKAGQYYVTGNVFEAGNNLTAAVAAEVNKDNWAGIVNNTGQDVSKLKLSSPVYVTDVTTHTAQDAYERVLNYAGCSLSRDEIDTRIVAETQSGTAQYIGKSVHNGVGDEACPDGVCDNCDNGIIHWKSAKYPKQGIIDSQEDLKPASASSTWSAWPTLKSTSAPKDTDGDGMPDDWEKSHGLDPNVNDANGKNLSTGYDNIEVYINSLVKRITDAEY